MVRVYESCLLSHSLCFMLHALTENFHRNILYQLHTKISRVAHCTKNFTKIKKGGLHCLQDNVNPLPNIPPLPCPITKDNNIPIRSSGILVNCRSAVNKIYLLDFLIQKHVCDLVLLTETWFDANVSNTYINQPEFQVFRKDRVGKRGGG